MKTRLILLFVILAIPSLFWFGCSDDEDLNPLSPSVNHRALTDRIQDKLEFMVKDSFQVAGAVVGIKFASDGELWVGTAGKANLGFDVDVWYDDRFKIGSITKCYVAHLALILADDGLIDLDEAATTYLPADYAALMPQDPDSVITVRRLLNHTAGLTNYNHTPEWDIAYYANPYKTWAHWELLMLARHGLDFTPGTSWTYSNTGYIYLGLIIENVTGHELSQELRDKVFVPLGLSSAEFCLTTNPDDIVDGYLDYSGNGKLDPFEVVTGVSPSIAWAAGSMVANASDMVRFMEAMIEGELLSPAMQTQRMENKIQMGMNPASYGLGIVEELTAADPAHHAIGHVGGIDGYTSAMFQDGYGNLIVVMVNGNTPLPIPDNNIAHHIFWTVRDMIAGNPPGVMASRFEFNSEACKAYMNGVKAYK